MLAIFVDSNIVILGVCGSKIGDFLQFSKIGDFWGFGTQKSEVFGKDLFRRISGRVLTINDVGYES